MNRFHGFFRKTESLTDIPGIFSALLRRYHKHLNISSSKGFIKIRNFLLQNSF